MTAPIAAGDERAFGEFYERWFDRVLARARSITRRDESFCLDVVQDCMMRVVTSMRPLRDERAVAAWMARAVFTTAVDRLRRDRRRELREREAVSGGGAAAEAALAADSLEQEEQAAWLRARLAELPVADRELVLERFEDGKTLDAIGAARGVSAHAAHGRIRRIVRRLRRAAAEVFGD